MLSFDSPPILLNVIIGIPLLVLFIKVHTILMVVKPAWWPLPFSIVGIAFLLLFVIVYWLISSQFKIGADLLSHINLIQVLFSAMPTILLLFFVFEKMNKLFSSKNNTMN